MTKTFHISRDMLYNILAILCSIVLIAIPLTSTVSAEHHTTTTRSVLRDGALIRLQSTNTVYAIQIDYVDAYKRYIANSLLSDADRNRIVVIGARTFSNYTPSDLVIEVTADGRIVDGKVYKIEHIMSTASGQSGAYKRHLDITPEQFTAAGFKWNAIFPATTAELNHPYYRLGEPLTATDFGMQPVVRAPETPAPTPEPEPAPQTPTSTPATPADTTAQTGSTPQPTPTNTQQAPQITYYTSKHTNARYYYPEDCTGWRSISPRNLESFDSLDALLARFDRSLSPSCQ